MAPSFVTVVNFFLALKFKHILRILIINMRNFFCLIYEANSMEYSNSNLWIATICRIRFAEFITGCAKLIFTLFYKIAAIFAILTLQRRVIQRWNGNFVGFMEIFSKIVKNVLVKQYLHFSGKWQKWQIS